VEQGGKPGSEPASEPNIYMLTPEERARRILELRSQGKTYKEIQKLLRVSPNDIARALRREAVKDELLELKTTVQRLEKQIEELKASLAENKASLEQDKADLKDLTEKHNKLVNFTFENFKTVESRLDKLEAKLAYPSRPNLALTPYRYRFP
jgi:DNA repair exonuclease SbcCD ATPase subunit